MTINKIWDSLIQESDEMPSPEWHQAELSARAERVKSGHAQFKPLAVAKAELQTKFNAHSTHFDGIEL